jgi:hypothetical protein
LGRHLIQVCWAKTLPQTLLGPGCTAQWYAQCIARYSSLSGFPLRGGHPSPTSYPDNHGSQAQVHAACRKPRSCEQRRHCGAGATSASEEQAAVWSLTACDTRCVGHSAECTRRMRTCSQAVLGETETANRVLLPLCMRSSPTTQANHWAV